MAPALVHFLVGASLALLCATPLALRDEVPSSAPLWLVLTGGLWGLAPDVHHITPVYESQLYAFHNTPWADLFAFHYTLDRPFVRARTDASIAGAILWFLGAVMVFTGAAQLRTRTGVARTRLPQFVALVVAVLPLVLLLATIGGGLPEITAWLGDRVTNP